MKQRAPSTSVPSTSAQPARQPPIAGAGLVAPSRGNAAAAEALQARIAKVAGSAQATLPHRARLEASFGADLSDVRAVLGGVGACALLDERNAEAVALGDAIVFADANPSAELVAHEVTHVLQQRRGGTGGGEAEAESTARAAASGQQVDVGGGAPETPQFSTKESAPASRAGTVTLGLSGAGVTPPGFAGGLPDLHDWLMDNQAALSNYSGPLNVTFSGTVKQSEQVIWSYYHPKQTLVLRGTSGAVVTGFTDAGGGKEYASPGYFLCYRPIIPQQMSAANPAAANFEMRGLTVTGYVSGGVEIDPRRGSMPSAEAWENGSFNEEGGHGSGGLEGFISGARIEDNTFDKLGTKYMKPGTERYAPHEEDGYKYCGYGGVVARGMSYSTIADNTFSHLENRDSSKTSSDGGDVNWLGLIHGVYLRDSSSYNSVRKNDFSTISGAPVKLTNHADYNKVRGNTSKNAGKDAFALEQYNPNGNPGGAVEADSAGYNKSSVGAASDKKKYITANHVGSAYSAYTSSSKAIQEFKEKRVGG